MGDWEPCFFWPCWKAASVASQSTWEGPPGPHPTPQTHQGWPGCQPSAGRPVGHGDRPGRGTGLCRASQERVPRRRWRGRKYRQEERDKKRGAGGRADREGPGLLSPGCSSPFPLPSALGLRVSLDRGYSLATRPCPLCLSVPFPTPFFRFGLPRDTVRQPRLCPMHCGESFCPFSVSPVCRKACSQEDRLESQADGSSNPASVFSAV